MQIAGVFHVNFDHDAIMRRVRPIVMPSEVETSLISIGVSRTLSAYVAAGSSALFEIRSMKKKVTGKDLTKEAPRSPRIRVGGYAILGRTIDKCRALVAGDIGEYHFDCPLDNMLIGFKGVKGEDFKAQIEQGASDQEMVEWLNAK